MATKYTTTILAFGNNAGIEVPLKNLEELSDSKRPKVTATLNDTYQFDTTVASRNGKYLLSFSKARRDESGLSAGDTVSVELKLVA